MKPAKQPAPAKKGLPPSPKKKAAAPAPLKSAPAKKATVKAPPAKKAAKKGAKKGADKPAGGPGSRQPVLTLSAEMPDGKIAEGHPLLYLMEKRLSKGDVTKTDVAKLLGVRPQSLYKWERECRANRNFPLPVLRAKQLAGFFRVKPDVFRPDFPWGAKQ
jgi:DNA-binding XRE family transcriptional regulator